MWKNIIESIPKNVADFTIQHYCEFYLTLLPENTYCILSLESLNTILNANENVLGINNITACISDFFNQGRFNELLSTIYHFFSIDFSYDYYEQPHDSNLLANYYALFDRKSSYYIYKAFNFEPDTLLSLENSESIYLFLFLYFLPQCAKNDLLIHPDKNIPLISCCKITNEAFDMLLYLMINFDSHNFHFLCKNYNLNHMLLENFIDNATQLYSFDDNTNWKTILPIYKMEKFLDYDCDFQFFEDFRDKKFLYTFPFLNELLLDYEKEHAYNKLQEHVPQIHYKKEKTVKI